MNVRGQLAEVRHSLALVQHDNWRPGLRVMVFKARAYHHSDRCNPDAFTTAVTHCQASLAVKVDVSSSLCSTYIVYRPLTLSSHRH
jgi:hypothetical protein